MNSWWNFERFAGQLVPIGPFWNSDNWRVLLQLLTFNFCAITEAMPSVSNADDMQDATDAVL